MKLTGKDIAEIARLLDDSQFTSLKLEMGEFRLRINRGGSRRRYHSEEDNAAPVSSASTAAATLAPAPAASTTGGPAAGEVDVPAPLLGNYYEAPRPGEEPFVKVGDLISEDTTIGIIEVMKLMNPIRAGVSGKVTAILAENGKAVEEGQALIRVKTGG